ncbi:MAG TPA: amidase [Beijerinckiaceae bacterium]|nr:amidase [Beijerinckiaceae bacterium]
MRSDASPKTRSFAASLADFASGADDSRAFLERCLAEYEAREPDMQAFVAVDLEGARAAADAAALRWKSGAPLSRIDGMPIGVKDIIETADMPTGMGSPLYKGWRSNRDAATVSALREAGAVIVGKTVTTEFAASAPGPTRNPYDLARTPGGSSSGSAAAVGSGMLAAGLGTQVVGSIIRPASYCGCWGYKPSLGGLNRGGSHDYMSQSCAGVIAATREDAWQAAREIVIRAGGDPGFVGISGPELPPEPQRPARLAFLETAGWEVAAPRAKEALQAVLAKLSAAGVEIVTRRSDATLAALEMALPEALALTRTINAWESRWPLNTYAKRDASKLSASARQRLREAEAMSLDDYRAAITRRGEIRALHAALAGTARASIALSAPDVAPVGIGSTGDPIFAVPASLLGAPALSLPLLSLDALPLGVQLIGCVDADAELFAIAGAVERISRALA